MLLFLVMLTMIMFSSAMYYIELTPDGCRAGGWKTGKGVACMPPATPNATLVEACDTGSSLTYIDACEFQCKCTDPNPYVRYVHHGS